MGRKLQTRIAEHKRLWGQTSQKPIWAGKTWMWLSHRSIWIIGRSQHRLWQSIYPREWTTQSRSVCRWIGSHHTTHEKRLPQLRMRDVANLAWPDHPKHEDQTTRHPPNPHTTEVYQSNVQTHICSHHMKTDSVHTHAHTPHVNHAYRPIHRSINTWPVSNLWRTSAVNGPETL